MNIHSILRKVANPVPLFLIVATCTETELGYLYSALATVYELSSSNGRLGEVFTVMTSSVPNFRSGSGSLVVMGEFEYQEDQVAVFKYTVSPSNSAEVDVERYY